jgi:hypothetical protein
VSDGQHPWGTDGVVSLPQPLETTDTALIDMQGFAFTPDGIRVNISRAEREDLIRSAFRPTRRS